MQRVAEISQRNKLKKISFLENFSSDAEKSQSVIQTGTVREPFSGQLVIKELKANSLRRIEWIYKRGDSDGVKLSALLRE